MRALGCGLAVILCATGCGPDVIPIQTAPVSGTATYQGKPLEGYRVYFYQADHAAKEPATGRIDKDGRFTLSVRAENDGAMVGPNDIWFSYDPVLPEQKPGFEAPIPLPPPKVKLSDKYLSQEKSGLKVDVPEEGLKDYKLDLN